MPFNRGECIAGVTMLLFFIFWRAMKKENEFQSNLIKEIKALLPGCYVLKNDPNYIQGFPDLLILYKDKWAALECKKEETSPKRPNQEYYISELGQMSYASFVFPSNKERVLHELQQTLGA